MHSQWNGNCRQRLSKRQWIKQPAASFRARTDADKIISSVFERNIISRQGEGALARAHQINFDQAGLRPENLLLFLEVFVPAYTATFVGRTGKLDDCDDLAASVLNFDIAFCNGRIGKLKNQWLRGG